MAPLAQPTQPPTQHDDRFSHFATVQTHLGTDTEPLPIHCQSNQCRSVFVDRPRFTVTSSGGTSPLVVHFSRLVMQISAMHQQISISVYSWMLTSRRLCSWALLLSFSLLPSSLLSMLPETPYRSCRNWRHSVRPLTHTYVSTSKQETLPRCAITISAHCATCAVYWRITSLGQLHAA